MAHPTAQHSRYPQSHPNSRDDSVRLPSLKDLNFDYQRGHRHQETPSHSPPTDSSVNTQDNSPRHPQPWARSHSTQTSSPMPAHQQHHQLHPHQQHTPPLSAGHDSAPSKIEYTSKADNGGFMTPGIPLSAQTVPIPGSVNIGLGTRTDDSSQGQSKRSRRGSANTAASRDVRTPHNTYTPQYASYPPTQPQPSPSHYHQISSTSSHPVHSPPSALDHIHPHATTVTQPTYGTYQQQYMAPRMYPQHPPPPQPASGNPYPSPGPPPAPPLQGPWEQAAAQHHPHPPPPQHSQHPQYTQHVSSHPPPPPQHLHMHPQQHQHHPSQPPPQSQPQALSPPPPSHPHHHPQQHAQQQQQQPQHQPQHQQQQQHPHHLHSQPQVQSQVQQQQLPFARTTAIVPTNIDTRPSYPGGEQVPSARDNTMSEIFRHCQALYSFASHYAQLQPNVQPTQSELAEMSQRAIQVVRLLEEYRRANLPEVERIKMDSAADIIPSDDHRPPKRPWEDMSQDGNADGAETAAIEQYPTPAEKPQSTAEQDMEIIRSKRATSAAGATGAAGQPKSKYRKRSSGQRATPPGKCHSCNIRETPEWRRGPDGARTLCNACGLHYAKLMRKSNKLHGGGGDAPRIDMDTLRASARAADLSDKPRSKRSQQSDEPTSPMESAKPLPQQHHQGSFQVVPMIPQNLTPNTPLPEPSRVPAQHAIQAMPQSTGSMSVPPPPWATTVPPPSAAARGYAPDQLQHQSFIRSSQHTTVNTSPR